MGRIERIALATDFGGSGPYMGQMRLRLSELAPEVPVTELVSDLPAFRADLTAYLLPALVRDIPSGTLFLCVVDPGVGGDRAALVVEADDNWFVGPDNGLFALITRRARTVRIRQIDWRPERLSASFHGRDLFAPVAATLCSDESLAATVLLADSIRGADWPDDSPRVVYLDLYGNLITGMRAHALDRSTILLPGGRQVHFARTFCEVPIGTLFWYENAFGLVEFAVNQGRADIALGLAPGDPIGLGD